jgi:serine phosphatase RsbU (regulator of sigma subunit)
VLFTDGLTEARNASGAEFGVERLCREVESVGARPAADIRDHLFAAVRSWAPAALDDRTLLVARRMPR